MKGNEGMSSASVRDIISGRRADLEQKQENVAATARVYAPQTQIETIAVKPAASSWEDLRKKLEKVVNLPNFMESRVRELYEQGYGAELETAAEIALETAKKSPYNLFATMISKKAGNWATKTLKVVAETWSVRRSAREVIERLKLSAKSIKPVLALAWRLKGSIIRFLGMALEKGTGIKNPAGVFFALTKKQQPTTA
jgi:hypothetical protein